MPTFSNFIALYPNKRYNHNIGANSLFNYLCNPKIIGDMIHGIEYGLPAVETLPQTLVKFYYSDPNFPLSERCNRQYVGKMICYIMNLYGYVPLKKKNINNEISSVFSSGHTYQKI